MLYYAHDDDAENYGQSLKKKILFLVPKRNVIFSMVISEVKGCDEICYSSISLCR